MAESRGVGPGFARALDELKGRGSNVLVVGNVPDGAWDRMSSQLLGRIPDRVRVLAMVDDEPSVARRRLRQAGAGMERSVVLDGLPTGSRSVAVESATVGGFEVRHVDARIDALGEALVELVEESERRFGPFEPAQFRLGVDSLQPLGEDAEPSEVRALVERVGEAVVDVGGMAHYGIQGEVTDELVRAVRPACDVVVELRQTNGTPEQRWVVTAYDETSPWTEL